jgi:peptide/nickel transport system substrate-binding protein
MKKNTIFILILSLVASLLVSGCTTESPTSVPESVPTEEPAELPTEAPAVEPTDTAEPAEPSYAEEIVIGIGRDLYYGHSQWHPIHGSLQVWEPLVYPDKNMNPQPFLASSWESNQDATEWTFHLREGISFHDGTPLTAEVAVENLLGTHENYTPLPTLDRIEVIDDTSFKIILTDPTPALPDLLVFFQSAMLAPATWAQDETDEPIPYGTGPFKFVDYVDGERIVLERNEDYWGEPAKVQRIVYRYIPDATTRLQALQSGEIDAIADVGSIIPSQGQLIDEDENLTLLTQEVLTTHYLFFNNDRAPFDDQTLRQAVSLAIDRELIVRETVYGYGVPGTSLITQLASSWVNPAATPTYNPEQAKALAQSVLGEERAEVTFVLNSGLANRWPYGEIAQIIQFALADLGIDVEIQTVEGGTWNEMLANDEYHISMRPYTMSSGDPDDFMTYWARTDGVFNGNYSISYSDQTVEALIDAAVSEVDRSAREAAYDEIQAILIEQTPFTPIYHEITLYATRSNVFDLTLDALFKPSLATVYKLED